MASKKPSWIKLALTTLVLFLFVSIFPAGLPVNAAEADDWPMFNHDLTHTGYSKSMAPRTNQTLWTFSTGGAVKASPAVVDGVVYVGSDDGYVYALAASDGSLLWKYNTFGPVQSSPAVVDGVVYVGGYHGHAVFALDASSGDLIWQSPTDSGYPDEISATAVADGLVYVTVANTPDYRGRLYAFNASTGNLTWQYIPSFRTWASPAVYNGLVYIGGSAGDIAALNATSGEQSWSHRGSNYNGHSSFSIGDGLVLIGMEPQELQAWDASSGAFVWSGNTVGAVSHSTPAIANEVVYVSTGIGGAIIQPGGITAIDVTTGALLWNHTIGSIRYSSPAVAEGLVFVGSDENSILTHDNPRGHAVYAIDSKTGATIWTYTTDGEVYSSPAVAYGIVYVGSNDGKVYAIGSTNQPTPTPVPELPIWIICAVLVVGVVFAALKATKIPIHAPNMGF
ncbi:MAG: PQQ-binding-like beta-propeller repeat protein [Candidatus Bathyarchaeota archaeon]|nr:PQQ-binding-like beta-propeller repeat protein [Candidatus Bathyarchaeota archaeon]